jgi:hypothetical protein
MAAAVAPNVILSPTDLAALQDLFRVNQRYCTGITKHCSGNQCMKASSAPAGGRMGVGPYIKVFGDFPVRDSNC